MLTLTDGRTAALEVTALAKTNAMQYDVILAAEQHARHAPGRWWSV